MNEKDLRTAVLTLRRALTDLLYVIPDDTGQENYADEISDAQQAIEYATDVLDPTQAR